MQYVTLTVPQHIYDQLGLHPNKTLLLKRPENICGFDTHGDIVSTSESAEVSSHCDELVLSAAGIDDACEENESSLQTQDGTFQTIHGNSDYAGNRDVRITYPRACGNCNQKYFTASSYFSHFDRCRFIPRIQKASYPDSSSGLNMIPEVLHGLGYDAPVLAEPEIHDTPEQNESSQIFGSGIDIERCLDSSDDFNMIPEALHALCYYSTVLSEPDINDATEENESFFQKYGGTSRVLLNPSNIDDAGKAKFQSTKAEFPRPCPFCEKMCDSNSTYYQHWKKCLTLHEESSFRKKKVTKAELRVLGYGTSVLAELLMNDTNVDEENESSFQIHDGGTSEETISIPSDAEEGIENAIIEYPRPCSLCDKLCNSSSMYYKHRRRCRPIDNPKNSTVIHYDDHGSSSDSSDHEDVTPEELSVLGGDPPGVLTDSEINKSNEGNAIQSSSESHNAFQGLRPNAHGVVSLRKLYSWDCEECCRTYRSKKSFNNHKKKCAKFGAQIGKSRHVTYPRVCAKCCRTYSCKGSFCNHKKKCAKYAAQRNESSRQEFQNSAQLVFIVDDPLIPEMNKMNEGEESNAGRDNVKTSRRFYCSDCRRDYSSKFAFQRHLKSCGHTRVGSIKRERIGDYVLPLSARRYHEPRHDKLMGASDKEDKPVNWVPVTTKPTSVLKYFVANKNSS